MNTTPLLSRMSPSSFPNQKEIIKTRHPNHKMQHLRRLLFRAPTTSDPSDHTLNPASPARVFQIMFGPCCRFVGKLPCPCTAGSTRIQAGSVLLGETLCDVCEHPLADHQDAGKQSSQGYQNQTLAFFSYYPS